MSTIRKIIERVDENKPNSFSTETKVMWLAQLDGKITSDVFLMDVAEVRQLNYDPVTDLDAQLLVRFPHDDIYYYWLCAKIDAENGEYDKYQNTMQLYNASYNNFVNWFLGCYEPADGCGEGFRRRVPSYYITAYGLAVKRGFVGTIDQWLASLHGAKGDTPYIGVNGNWWIAGEDTGVGAGYRGPVIPGGILYGDVNGDGEVNAKDARQILLYLSGEITEAALRLELADVNGDGVVDETDSVMIEQYAAGFITGFATGKYANWTPRGEYFYCDLMVSGISAQTEIMVAAPGVEIVKTECMDGAIRVYVMEVPTQDIPYSLHFGCSGGASGAAVIAISVTEAADGSVTMVNTFESGGTETIVIGADASGNPNKLTVNGKEIPIEWVVSE